MNKRGVQLATGLIFAGMVAMTGCGSAQTTGAEAPETTGVETEAPATDFAEPEAEAPAADVSADTEAVEEVEVPIEENESTLSDSGNRGEIGKLTNFRSLKEVENSVTSKQGFAYLNLQGAKVSAIAVANELSAANTTHSVSIYTKKDGEDKLYLAGTLDVREFKISGSGVLYSSYNGTYETYFLSTDGRSLEHKDYIEYGGVGEDCKTAYFRANNTSSKEYRQMKATEFYAMKQDVLQKWNDVTFTRGTK